MLAWAGRGPQRCLARRPNLARQRIYGGRRVSYFFADPREAEAARVDVEAAGYAALLSANVFFDVLPPGVNKGQTLLRLLAHEQLAERARALRG